jgi:hypothetical protein
MNHSILFNILPKIQKSLQSMHRLIAIDVMPMLADLGDCRAMSGKNGTCRHA